MCEGPLFQSFEGRPRSVPMDFQEWFERWLNEKGAWPHRSGTLFGFTMEWSHKREIEEMKCGSWWEGTKCRYKIIVITLSRVLTITFQLDSQGWTPVYQYWWFLCSDNESLFQSIDCLLLTKQWHLLFVMFQFYWPCSIPLSNHFRIPSV